jgi:hypothetical protein
MTIVSVENPGFSGTSKPSGECARVKSTTMQQLGVAMLQIRRARGNGRLLKITKSYHTHGTTILDGM